MRWTKRQSIEGKNFQDICLLTSYMCKSFIVVFFTCLKSMQCLKSSRLYFPCKPRSGADQMIATPRDPNRGVDIALSTRLAKTRRRSDWNRVQSMGLPAAIAMHIVSEDNQETLFDLNHCWKNSTKNADNNQGRQNATYLHEKTS